MKKLSENDALSRLHVNSFSEISKDNFDEFVLALPKMDPEVAKKALDQFPEYVTYASSAIRDYKDTLFKAIESGEKGFDTVAKGRLIIIESLGKMLESDNLTFEQKMTVAEKMNEISDKSSLDLERHHNFMIEGLKSLAMPCVFVIGIGLSIFGMAVRTAK